MSDNREDILKQIFINPEVTARAVDLMVPSHTKPKGWSRRSNATYYREVYAHQIQPVIDEMMTDEKDRWYLYTTWAHMSPQTIYLRINQSLRYLTDILDPEHKYAKFLEKVDIFRVRGKGILLTLKLEHRESTADFKPEVDLQVAPTTELPKWRQKMDTWLSKSKAGDKPLIIEGLMLSPDEIKNLKLEFVSIKNVMPSITSATIKLIKVRL